MDLFGPSRMRSDTFGCARKHSEAFGRFPILFEFFLIFVDVFALLPIFFRESRVLEELGIFERHWQIPRRKPVPVVRLFLLYDPWRRGKRVETCF